MAANIFSHLSMIIFTRELGLFFQGIGSLLGLFIYYFKISVDPERSGIKRRQPTSTITSTSVNTSETFIDLSGIETSPDKNDTCNQTGARKANWSDAFHNIDEGYIFF